jgi:hypothetical protein
VSPQRLSALGFRLSAALTVLWLAGALVIWNVVFDSHIVRGAREYVDRQELFVQGRGPQADMARSMSDAKRVGARAASLWASAELAAGAVVAATISAVRRRRGRDAKPGASR